MIAAIALGALVAAGPPASLAAFCEALIVMRPHVAAAAADGNPLTRSGPVRCEALSGKGRSCRAVPDAQGPGSIRCSESFVRPFADRAGGRLSAAMLFVAAHELAHLARSKAGSAFGTASLVGSEDDLGQRLVDALNQQTESIEEERETDALALKALRRVLLTPDYRYGADPGAGLWSAGANLRQAFGRPAVLEAATLDELPVPIELVDRAAAETVCAVVAQGDVSRIPSLPSTHPSWSSRAWRIARELAPTSGSAPPSSPMAGAPHELLVEWSGIEAFTLEHEADYLELYATRIGAAVAAHKIGKISCPTGGEPRWAGRRLSPLRTEQCPDIGLTWKSVPVRRSAAHSARPGAGPFAVDERTFVIANSKGIVRQKTGASARVFDAPCTPMAVATDGQRSAVQCRGGSGWVMVDWAAGWARHYTPDFGGHPPFPLAARGAANVGGDLVLSFGTAGPGYLMAVPMALDGKLESYPRGEQRSCDELQQLGAPRPFATGHGLRIAVADQLCARDADRAWSCDDPPVASWMERAFDDDAPPQPAPTFACGPGARGRSLCLDVSGRVTVVASDGTVPLGKVDVSLGGDATVIEWCSAKQSSWLLLEDASDGDGRTLISLEPNPPSAKQVSADSQLACGDDGAWLRTTGAPRKLP